MPGYTIEIAAADLALNNDLLQKQSGSPVANLDKAQYARFLRRVGLSGSNAAGDMKVAIKIGTREVARILNITLLQINMETGLTYVGLTVPANTSLSAIVVDAGGTSVGYLYLEFDEPASV